MQKWQDKKKQRVHQLKVQNAKSSIRRYSNSRQKVPNSGNLKRTPQSKYIAATPINKILQIFKLEQYGSLLIAYGFPQQLTQKKSLSYLDEMMEQVAEKDKQRFISLLNTLTIMSKDVHNQTKTPKSTSKQKKVYYPPPPSTSLQSRQAPNSVQKSQKGTVKFRVKQKNTIGTLVANKNNLNKPPLISRQNASRKSDKTRQNSTSTDKRHKKSFSHKAVDDLSLIHDFTLGNNNDSGILRPINQSNKFIQKLMQKLQTINPNNPQDQNKEDIKLQMQKIKHMYLSFDSATLTSNIINIDLHQMIQCFAMQVKFLITQGQINNLAKSNAHKIKSLLHQSFVLVKQQSKQSRNLQQHEYLPEKQFNNNSLQGLQLQCQGSPKNNSIKHFNNMRQIDVYDEQNRNIQNQFDTDKSSQQQESQKSQNCSIDLNRDYTMKQSSIWGNSYIASVINDFSCFDNIYEGFDSDGSPKQQDLKNFIQLVVMAGRMEKEVPIIAYVYLKRLLGTNMVKQAKITSRNWRNLLLVTLIQASKIWDDQSLENHSFAKLIKPFTTLQINRLEKYLVYFLDYRLTIDQKQYSEAYFKLRKHVGEKQSTQSANLLRLDLKTIQKLQQSGIYSGSNGKSKKNIEQKKEYFKKLMNKSF